MAQLAIKGHKTRGNEVIEILEMLGGKTSHECSYKDGFDSSYFFFIDKNFSIDGYAYNSEELEKCYILTLEEFLEKFPYKIGDKVQHKGATSCGRVYVIECMKWVNNHTEYEIRPLYDYNHTGLVTVTAEDLQPYEEETMEERKYANLRLDVDQDDKLATEATIDSDKITPPENYLIGKITKVDNGMIVEFVKKQPQYPKTYAECCDVLSISPYYNLRYYTYEHCYNEHATANKLCSLQDKLNIFGKLLICRDAYWKIAGEQMGLGKPWEFKLGSDSKEVVYAISLFGTGIMLDFYYALNCNKILVFPTEEMRDDFYKNFKNLIEQCKELL